jgi:GT2 family glycosyltransferase
VRRTAAIGDSLSAVVVAQKLNSLGFTVTWQTHPMIASVIQKTPWVTLVEEPKGQPHVNLDGAYERDPYKRQRHFNEVWIDTANHQLRRHGVDLGPPTNCRPIMQARRNDQDAMRRNLAQYPRPWIVVCPRSDSYNVRQVPNGIWEQAAKTMVGTKIWIGRDPAPPGFLDLRVGHIDHVVGVLSVADLYVGVDTGPLHIAAALGVPCVAIGQSSMPDAHLSEQRDYITITPPLDCLHCMENVCPKSQHSPPCQQMSPELIAVWANARVNCYSDGKVSCVIPTWRPQVQKLNKCLAQVLDQVDEIIVTREESAIMPPGAMKHPKIRYVVKNQTRIGFGRNVNFGARATNHQWLLILNDDCYLNPGAVDKMLAEAKPDTGILTPLLRYPNGTIYHSGKARQPGARGWEHLDWKQANHRYRTVTELENSCGCCFLMPRKVFYTAGGFDEDFFIYSEDDDLCMRVRRAGYRILFVPHADGIHDEGMSTRMVPGILDEMKRSNAIFAAKWGQYLDHNANNVPLGNWDF